MLVEIDRDSDTALWKQVYDEIKHKILVGDLPPNTQLPAARSLAEEIGVSFVTVNRAYRELVRENYVYSGVGRGTHVAHWMHDVSSAQKMTLLTSHLSEAKDIANALNITREEFIDLYDRLL